MPFHTPLDIVGNLQAEVGDSKVRITAERDAVTVAVPNLQAIRTAMRSVGPGKARRRALARAQQAMEATSLTVRFQVGGGTVAVLGAASQAGWLSRIIGVAPLELKISGLWYVLRSLWRRG